MVDHLHLGAYHPVPTHTEALALLELVVLGPQSVGPARGVHLDDERGRRLLVAPSVPSILLLVGAGHAVHREDLARSARSPRARVVTSAFAEARASSCGSVPSTRTAASIRAAAVGAIWSPRSGRSLTASVTNSTDYRHSGFG